MFWCLMLRANSKTSNFTLCMQIGPWHCARDVECHVQGARGVAVARFCSVATRCGLTPLAVWCQWRTTGRADAWSIVVASPVTDTVSDTPVTPWRCVVTRGCIQRKCSTRGRECSYAEVILLVVCVCVCLCVFVEILQWNMYTSSKKKWDMNS